MSDETGADAGGQPLLPLPTSDGHHNRADLAMIERAVRKGWKIPEDWTDKLPEVAARIAADPGKHDRDRLRALELIATLLRDNVSAAVALDKINRLDQGKATENVATVQYIKGIEEGDV